MSAYSSTPGNNYPPLHQIHPNLHAHASGQSPVGAGETAHSLSHHIAPSQPYTYGAQPAPQLQLSYANDQTNGNGNGNLHGDARPDQLQQSAPTTPATASGSGGQQQKASRLRKACDSCSMRKVKCDETKPECRACAVLRIPCTFNRATKRRGPPNKVANRLRNDLAMGSPEGDSPGFTSSTSPNNVAATLASLSSHGVLRAESICPLPLLELFIDDFFTYLHPLCPFPHEPSFRDAFKKREDLNNPSLLALLASMVGALVASFPRKPRLHLKAQHQEHLFPTSISLVTRCHKVAVGARGVGYLDKDLTIYDAVTSYFLGLAAAYTHQWTQARLYFGETMGIMRIMGAHKANNQGAPQGFFETQQLPADCIRQEIGRRVFWVMFVSIRSMQQYGALFGELLIPPPTPNDPYPPLPAEVDDEYIFRDHIEPQPAGVVSRLVGYNLNIKIYSTVTPLATMELAYGIDEVFDWNRQKRVLEDCLRSVKQVLASAPRELLLQADPQTSHAGPSHQHYPSMINHPDHRNSNDSQWLNATPEARRHLQFEIQKANIYASQLCTRSSIVEKYWNLQEAYEKLKLTDMARLQNSPGVIASGLDGILSNPKSGEDVEAKVKSEREDIVHDLLIVLCTISQVNMEPNGGSLNNKIRQIASTLIDTPQNRKGQWAPESEAYLTKFLDILMKLEKVSPSLSSRPGDGEEDEEEELRNWADLRQYQMSFAQAGGFLGQQ